MKKQLGILASLLFLSATALIWTGCCGSSRYCDDCCYRQPVCPEPCAPACCEPCKPVCPPCPPAPCKPACAEPCVSRPAQYAEACAPQLEPCAPRNVCPPPCPCPQKTVCCPPPCPPEPCAPRNVCCPPPCPPEPCAPRNVCCPPPCAPEPCAPRNVCCPPPCAPEPCAPKPVCCPPPCAPEPCAPKPVCCPPPCQEPCAPKPVCCPPPCPPVCPPKCAAPLKACKHGTSCECACSGVTVRARNPKLCMLGDQYPLDVEVTACCDVCDVVLTAILPEGVTFVRSQPEARAEGRRVVWEFGSMSRGQTIPGRIWLRCEREGEVCTCFCVKATPVAFCALLCAKPILVCEKCGPKEVGPGDPINYTITVTNIGTATAEEVVVTDTLPDGVEHSSFQRVLNFKLGCLEPCQTKKVNFCVTPCKRGEICNTAIVTACNANQTSCEWCTCVACCASECRKCGPEIVMVGQNADYEITVMNTGDKPLHEIVVTDTAPSATAIVTAPGACISGKQAVWRLRELQAGQCVKFNITLTTCTPGYFVNRATVTNCEGCNGCCEFGTTWKGRPALEVCIENAENPVCVGETSTFNIIVANKGQEYDSNVRIVAHFPPGLEPINASGPTPYRINGQEVEFAPSQNFAPRQKEVYKVTVRARNAGDLRPKVEVSSDAIKNPIVQEESLIVN